MQIAIVGLAAAGKTTVFNTLTRGHAETGGFGGLQLNVGVVKVPDERLDRLAEIFKPKKVVQADVTYVDLPAPPRLERGPGRDRGAAGGAPRPAARLGRAAPRRPRRSRTRRCRMPRVRSTRGATSSGSTSSSSWPTWR